MNKAMQDRKKVFVKTYGCQMNVYDSARMQDALEQDGYVSTSNADDADLVLLNTCHIREKAAEKLYSDVGRLRKIKDARADSNRPLQIGVTGCVAQAEGAEIMARAPAVDMVAGPQTYHRITEIVKRARSGERPVETEFDIEEKFEKLPLASRKQVQSRGVAAFLTIQEGCDKFCTFCVVPYTRGAEVSRPVSQIIAEAKSLIDAGVREITLLGQNVNAWHGLGTDGHEWRLGQLLYELANISGLERLRYTTSHPVDMDESLYSAHRDIECLMPYLHLPVQAGSDRVLMAMNRHHTISDYLKIIDRMRDARPDIAISGDFIVGFPGETDAEFEETINIVKEVKYASAFSFNYSPRPGTPGSEMEEQIPDEVKSERLQRLQALLNSQQQEFNQSCVGTKMGILLEKPGRKPGQLIGRSPWLQSVVVDEGLGKPGDMVQVEVTHAGPNSLNAMGI